MNASLVTDKLTKHFGDFSAVEGLDLAIRPGQIFGLLGFAVVFITLRVARFRKYLD